MKDRPSPKIKEILALATIAATVSGCSTDPFCNQAKVVNNSAGTVVVADALGVGGFVSVDKVNNGTRILAYTSTCGQAPSGTMVKEHSVLAEIILK